MRIQHVKDTIKAAYLIRQPLMIWGEPGVGKSSASRQAAEELGRELKIKKFGYIDLRLGTLEPIDLRGILMNVNGKSAWAPPAMLPTEGHGILNLDRRIGDYKLPDGWHVIGCGNRATHRSASFAMPKMMANRFVHVNAEVNVEDFLAWGSLNKIDLRVIAFIKFRQGLLHVFDPNAKGDAFPTPRSWEFVSNMLSSNLPPHILLDVLRGCVGEGAAAEFHGFLKVFAEMLTLEDVERDPMGCPLPNEPATLWAVSTMLAAHANAKNVRAIIKWFTRVSDGGRPDYAVHAIREMKARNPELVKNAEFIAWATKFQVIF